MGGRQGGCRGSQNLNLDGRIKKKRTRKMASMPSNAKIASDWVSVWQWPDEHLSEVVCLKKGVDPDKLISDFAVPNKFGKKAIDDLARENIVRAGALNGKKVKFFRDRFAIQLFRTLAEIFFFDVSDFQFASREVLLAGPFLNMFGDTLFPSGVLPKGTVLRIDKKEYPVRNMADVFYAYLTLWAKRYSYEIRRIDCMAGWVEEFWPLVKVDPKTGKNNMLARPSPKSSTTVIMKALRNLSERLGCSCKVQLLCKGSSESLSLQEETTDTNDVRDQSSADEKNAAGPVLPGVADLAERLKEYNCLAPTDITTLVVLALNRWLVRQTEESQSAIASAKDSAWCRDVLKIDGPLLKELSHDEQPSESLPSFVPFSPFHRRILLSKDYVRVDVPAFAMWAFNAGVPVERICVLLKAPGPVDVSASESSSESEEDVHDGPEADNAEFLEVPEPQQTKPTPAATKGAGIGELFEKDIKANYPTGFDFKESSLRLVEGRINRKLFPALITGYKLEMMERSDGLYFFSDMIIPDEAREQLKERAERYLLDEGMVALDALQEEFAPEFRMALSCNDFKAYFIKFIADDIGGKVRGHEGWRMCFRQMVEDEEAWESVAERVRGVIVDAGDAISIDDVLLVLPFLDREVIERIREMYLKNVVVLDVDSVRYLKLLEYFYLPDDFALVLNQFVQDTESEQSVTSIVLLEGMLNEHYGDSFRVNYGLENEDVFKQVVAMSCGLDGYVWKRDMYVREDKKASSNVVDMFLLGHNGIFHDEEFFAFAKETRGMLNRGMLIATFLRKYCIRLSKEWWVSVRSFDEMFGLNEGVYLSIGEMLNAAVSGKPFLPISVLPQAFYDSLPRLVSGEKEYEWNAYLLTSVAVAKIKNAVVMNDEPSPYTVTAIIVPPTEGVVGDIVEYVLNSCPKGFFPDTNAAFEYLKSNNIRLTRTDKLLAKISQCIV